MLTSEDVEGEFRRTLKRDITLRYFLRSPGRAELDSSPPLILFLHGASGRGANLALVHSNGLDDLLAQVGSSCAILAPQCPPNTWWIDHADAVMCLLDDVLATRTIDPRRICLTGFSMGGAGAWYIGSRWPERFAAVAPVCGAGLWWHGFPESAKTLKDVPVWTFHGQKDDVVGHGATEGIVTALREHGGAPRFDSMPDTGHDECWRAAYQNPELYRWMLEQRNQRA